MNMPKAGVGFSESNNSFDAGKQAAEQAINGLNKNNAAFAIAFCTNKHNFQEYYNGIKSVTGYVPIIGGSAIGVITNENLGYEGYQAGIAVLPKGIDFQIISEGNLDKDEKKVGLKLGSQLSGKRNSREKLILLFYESVKSPPPPMPVLNVSSFLLNGFLQMIGKNPPLLVGAGLIGSFAFECGKIFSGFKLTEQSAVAALLSGDFSVDTSIMHGCKPISDYHTITKVEGPVVYEIDGIPAVDAVNMLLGSEDWQKQLPLLLLTMGVNHGEKYAPYDEKNYVNRLILGVIPEEKAVVLFEADFENGTEFQFMRRNSELMEKSAEKNCREIINRLRKNRQEPLLALYIDCAGRTAGFSGAETEEAAVVQKIIGCEMPLLGFYSGVEIAPLMRKSRGLDWTGVLLILSRGMDNNGK